jgi:hypothetical protein
MRQERDDVVAVKFDDVDSLMDDVKKKANGG